MLDFRLLASNAVLQIGRRFGILRFVHLIEQGVDVVHPKLRVFDGFQRHVELFDQPFVAVFGVVGFAGEQVFAAAAALFFGGFVDGLPFVRQGFLRFVAQQFADVAAAGECLDLRFELVNLFDLIFYLLLHLNALLDGLGNCRSVKNRNTACKGRHGNSKTAGKQNGYSQFGQTLFCHLNTP